MRDEEGSLDRWHTEILAARARVHSVLVAGDLTVPESLDAALLQGFGAVFLLWTAPPRTFRQWVADHADAFRGRPLRADQSTPWINFQALGGSKGESDRIWHVLSSFLRPFGMGARPPNAARRRPGAGGHWGL